MTGDDMTRSGEGNGGGQREITLRDGVRFFFDVDGVTIEVWGSSWSGREEVRVEGAVVSSKRSLRRSTWHQFSYGGHDYRVLLACRSVFTGEFLVELHRDGELIDSDVQRMVEVDADGKVDWRKAFVKILPYLVLGLLAGAATGFIAATLLLK